MKSLRVLFSCLLILSSFSLTAIASESPTSADTVSLFYDPDFPLASGQTLATYYASKRYLYVYREIVPIEGGGNTFFNILGSNAGDYPEFFGGIQTFKDGRPNAAIFSAWDKRSYCTDCAPGSTDVSKQVSIVAKGLRTETRPFGYQGTGVTSLLNDFNWKYGEKISMLAVVEPSSSGYLLSAAIKRQNLPWEFIISFSVPAPFITGMPGNYSFLQDFGNDPKIKRSYLVGPSILEDDAGNQIAFTNVFVSAYNASVASASRHSIELDGSWIKVTTGIDAQTKASKEYRFQLPKPNSLPNYSEAKVLLAKQVAGRTLRTSPISVGSAGKPQTPTFRGVNFVDNQVIINVNLGSKENRPTKVYLVSPKLGISTSKPLAATIEGDVASWKLSAGNALPGSEVKFEFFGELDGIQSDRSEESFFLPSSANRESITEMPLPPRNFKYVVIGSTALITVQISTKISQTPSRAFLTSESLRIMKNKPLPGDLTSTKAIFEIPITPGMLGKKFPVSIFLRNDKGDSKPLQGTLSIQSGIGTPTAPRMTSTQPKSPKTVICTRPSQSRAFQGTSCPPGWVKR